MSVNILETSPEAFIHIRKSILTLINTCLAPPPKLNLVEWADKYRFLPDNSAEPGRWKTDRVEVVREPMLSVTNPEVREITIMCCIQLMKTELMINTALYYMHQEPSPILYCAPKKELAEAWSKERFMKSVLVTPVISDIFSVNRRGEGNTITQKQFRGGQISIVSARNPSDLAMRAVRILLFDECNKYPANSGAGEGGSKGEGDPISIAWGRSTTYRNRAKKITACSPTIQDQCRISFEYSKSNRSVYIQPCPHCDHRKVLTWKDVLIPKDEHDEFIHLKAAIVCSECGVIWNESDRHKSIRNGYWEITRPKVTWHHGYKVSSLASPFIPVVELGKEFVDAQGNLESLKTFYNTRMSETWKEVGERPEWRRLYERRDTYKIGTIPDGGLLLTIGIDIQKTYIVYEVVAWGKRKESWSVDSGTIQGDISDDSTKDLLARFLDLSYKNSSGIDVPIMKGCIDSGFKTQEVYAFVRSYGSDRIVSVKGDKIGNLQSTLGIAKPVDVNIEGKRIARGLLNWPVGSSVIKEQIYRWLNSTKPTESELAEGKSYPSGYCHFPEYSEEFFKQLTGEESVKETDKYGFSRNVWKKMRDDNHFLDCRVYNRAGSAMLQIDRMNDDDWSELHKIWHPEHHVTDNVDLGSTVTDNTRKTRKGTWIPRN